MAWMRDVTRKCPTCGRPATHEVLNTKNAGYGIYCARDAKKRVIELNRKEAEVRLKLPAAPHAEKEPT